MNTFKLPRCIRTVAIVLLFAMFHYVAGYRLMYSLGILYAKKEAKEYMVEKNNIKKLTLSPADYSTLKWTENNKEFSFQNNMYDVSAIQKLGDDYVITVYVDDNETGWVSSFHNFEKELFHPDQAAKGAKSAETIMSSFQKDYTRISGFKINLFSSAGLIQPIVVAQQHALQVFDNIWRPPTLC